MTHAHQSLSGGGFVGEWSRERWLEYADRLLTSARIWASPNRSRIVFPGATGGYGNAVDGLEGFARTFLLAGFRIAGARGAGVDELIDFYTRGVTAGVDPDGPDRWVGLAEHPQAKVEAASIALILDLTRPWIWSQLDATTQQRVIGYLAPAVGDETYPRTNWLWFRVVVQTFLRSVGGPWSPDDIAADLALHDSFVAEDGWLSDGDERSYDHYVGWALQMYPILWSRMKGAAELANGRTGGDVARLDRFLQDAIALVGGDGSPLIEGRSLSYRFAAAAPFWVGVLAEVPSLSAGALRHAASRIVSHFADHGVPDDRGLLTLGWHGEWRQLAQAYSGPGSPYWAAKGMLGIALPADHPAWAAPVEPLPVERGDTLRGVRAAGWLISGTHADGIVRVVNHGTDHAVAGSLVGDSPLYARLGYSTANSPLLDDEAWREPLEQSVCLVDIAGSATHRTGMQLLEVRVQNDGRPVGVAASTWNAHWLVPGAVQERHGAGLAGVATIAGRLTVCSLVRGPWEIRLARVDSLAPGIRADTLRLRIGGWAVAAREPVSTISVDSATVGGDGITSTIRAVLGEWLADVTTRSDASPLGAISAVPMLTSSAVVPGEWTASLLELSVAPVAEPGRAAALQFVQQGTDTFAVATWPDGTKTSSNITNVRFVDTREPAFSSGATKARAQSQRSTKE